MQKPWLILVLLACAALSSLAAERAPSATSNVVVLPQPLVMPGLDRQRTLRLYLPPSYAQGERRYPVIYMHDGQNLFDYRTRSEAESTAIIGSSMGGLISHYAIHHYPQVFGAELPQALVWLFGPRPRP